MIKGFVFSDKMLDIFPSFQLMLGDIVISVETAARQAEERGHTLLDEIRILMVRLGIFLVLIFSFLKLCLLLA